jgi:hypothetical protein
MAMVPAMVMMVTVTPPTHFRRRRLDVVLDGRGGAGIAQRKRVGALGRRGDSEHCANGGKPQNFRHLHMSSPYLRRSRPQRTALDKQAASPQRGSQIEADDVNAI